MVCELELWSNNDGLFSDDGSIFESNSTSESPQRSPLDGAILGSVSPSSGTGLSRLNICAGDRWERGRTRVVWGDQVVLIDTRSD